MKTKPGKKEEPAALEAGQGRVIDEAVQGSGKEGIVSRQRIVLASAAGIRYATSAE